MRFILLLFLLLPLESFAVKQDEVVKRASIRWGDHLYLTLNEKGFRSSKGARVFASFALQNDFFRSVSIHDRISFPLHNIVLLSHEYTIYILNLKKREKIGQFKIPSRGTPRFIKIEPYKNGYTSLKVMFRMLPRERTAIEKSQRKPIGRPGPLITKVIIYKDGSYQYLKK